MGKRLVQNQGLLYIAPWFFGYAAFMLGPVIYAIYLSFTNSKLGSPAQFIGLSNYLNMFKDDFWVSSVFVTLKFTLMFVPIQLVLSFSLALLLNQGIKGASLYRNIYYLPSMVSGIAYGYVWMLILSPSGIASYLFHIFGKEAPVFLQDPAWALPSLVLISIWSIGPPMIIFHTAIKNINKDLYESCDMDGGNFLQKTWRITIPLATPSILFNLITIIVASFQQVVLALALTQGGPINKTYFYAFNTYVNAFRMGKIGYAAANSIFLFIIVLVVTFIVMRTSRYWVHYEINEGK